MFPYLTGVTLPEYIDYPRLEYHLIELQPVVPFAGHAGGACPGLQRSLEPSSVEGPAYLLQQVEPAERHLADGGRCPRLQCGTVVKRHLQRGAEDAAAGAFRPKFRQGLHAGYA